MNSDRKAVQDFFGLERSDIICWEYGLRTVSVPNYMIVRDPETNAIIISIRGTMVKIMDHSFFFLFFSLS